ncbi:MAG: hypothetical protein KJ062_08325 [Thermoanaerobaculia bacterium]|nr:hypothetical protein [Thermoanaerobaculia bacterium]
MNDTIKVSIESPRLTLTATHTPTDTEGLRQTLALIQTFLRSLVGDVPSEPSAAPRRGRPRASESVKTAGGEA